MQCKFLEHGIAIAYDQIIKPCCAWSYDHNWSNKNKLVFTDLATFHSRKDIIEIKNQLAQNLWPATCKFCENVESQNRADSIRGSANSEYANLADKDITLEIRPGSVCNFACQTCWPEASSRVAQYHHQAKLIDIKNLDSNSIENFDFLLPVADRIKNVTLLGGEPFYDKNCLKFLAWAAENLNANLILFTNGSQINWDWVQRYNSKITLVFSIDAVGKPAEYIRYGTIWNNVINNYTKAREYKNVELRVNITTSVYNYIYISDVIDMLLPIWPKVVSFGVPHQPIFLEHSVPVPHRLEITNKLKKSIKLLLQSKIQSSQRDNAVFALNSIIKNLNFEFNLDQYNNLKQFVHNMDTVKKISIKDYCPEVAAYF